MLHLLLLLETTVTTAGVESGWVEGAGSGTGGVVEAGSGTVGVVSVGSGTESAEEESIDHVEGYLTIQGGISQRGVGVLVCSSTLSDSLL